VFAEPPPFFLPPAAKEIFEIINQKINFKINIK